MNILTDSGHITTWIKGYYDEVLDNGSFCEDCPYNKHTQNPSQVGNQTVYEDWNECTLTEYVGNCPGVKYFLSEIKRIGK